MPEQLVRRVHAVREGGDDYIILEEYARYDGNQEHVDTAVRTIDGYPARYEDADGCRVWYGQDGGCPARLVRF